MIADILTKGSPNMADDEAGSVTDQAVENGQEEPSEDRVDDAMQEQAEASRTIPVASTIPSCQRFGGRSSRQIP